MVPYAHFPWFPLFTKIIKSLSIGIDLVGGRTATASGRRGLGGFWTCTVFSTLQQHLCFVLVTTVTLLRRTKLSLIFLVSEIQIISTPVVDKERPDMRLGLGSQNGSNCREVLAKLTNSLHCEKQLLVCPPCIDSACGVR